MAGIHEEHVAVLLADNKLRELPRALTDVMKRVPDAGILRGLKKIDGAVDQALLECDDLGDRLLARIYRHYADSADKKIQIVDPQTYNYSLACVSRGALRFFMKHGKPAKYCALANAAHAVALGALAELSQSLDEADELLVSGIEHGEASVSGFSEVENAEEWFKAYCVLIIANLQRSRLVKSVSEICSLLERAAELAEKALRLGKENLASRNLAVLKTYQATSYRELSRFLADDSRVENMLVRAIDIQDDALDMLDRKKDRSEWIEGQENLGNLRLIQWDFLDGAKARRCVSAAGKAYKAALSELSMNRDSARWSRVNLNLGSTLRGEAGLTLNVAESARLLKDAISAYRKAATFIRRENFPEEFPRLAFELGSAHFELAQLSKGKKSRDLLQRSIEIFEFEAADFDYRRDPDRWLSYKLGLSRALRHLGERSLNDDLAMRNYRRSAENVEEALHVIDAAGHDLLKASVREFLGCVYFAMSHHATDEDSADALLEKSIESFEDGVRHCRGEASAMRDEMKIMATLMRRFRENKEDEGLMDAASKMMRAMKLH